MPSPNRAAAFALVVAAAALLAACGKKGDLDYPAGTKMETREQPDGSTKERPRKPSRPFVLDGLLN